MVATEPVSVPLTSCQLTIFLADENTYPSLIGEDPGQKTSSCMKMRSLRYDRGRHRIVSSDADAHQEPKTEDPNHLQCWCRYTVRKTDNQNGADDANNQFLAVHELSAESITKKTER